MENMGLEYAWQQADFVSKSIAIVLLIMSVLSWTVIIIKGIKLLRLNGKQGAATFWSANSFREGIARLQQDNHVLFWELAIAGFAADSHRYNHSSALSKQFDMSDWIERCLKDVLDDQIAKLQSGLAILASIGSTAPFVGLFGTVWGIYHALKVIGASGEASLAQVAGPVGEALIMTAFGLFVAIPAVLGYNALARQNKAISHQLCRFASGLHAYFLTGARVNLDQHTAKPEAESEPETSPAKADKPFDKSSAEPLATAYTSEVVLNAKGVHSS